MMRNRYKYDSEVKSLQIDALSSELKLTKNIYSAVKANVEVIQDENIILKK